MKPIEEFTALLDEENVEYRVVNDVGKDTILVISPLESSKYQKTVLMALRQNCCFILYCALTNHKTSFKTVSERLALLEELNRLNLNAHLSTTSFYVDESGDVTARQMYYELKKRRLPSAATLMTWLEIFTMECDMAIDEINKALRQKPAEESNINMDPFANTDDT